MKTALLIGIGFLVMTGIDAIRLTFFGGPLFRKTIGPILKDSPEIAPALGVWLVLTIGLYLFIIQHPTYGSTRQNAMIYGGIFGGITYAVYELTNIATLQGRTYKMVAIDIIWGMILCGISSGILYLLSQKFL